MVTQVNLYNKYRPKHLDEIVGQKAVFSILSNAIAKERISKAYLFRGPRGSGKTSVARILCKAVNCENLQGFMPCDACEGCKYALYDAEELDAASHRGIDDMKELINNLNFRPQHVDKKFIIIDEAHQLTAAAVNALLKIVEEPPTHVFFIFCTTEHPSDGTATDKAFLTLSSRCQLLQFMKITPMDMVTKLTRICTAEDCLISHDILMGIVGKSDGSLRDAENILDTLLTLYDSEPPEQIISFLYGEIESLSLDLFKNCCIGTITDGFLAVRKLWESGGTPPEVARLCVQFASSVVHLQAGLTVYYSSDIVGKLKEISLNVGQNKLEAIASVFSGVTHSQRDDLFSLEVAVCDVFGFKPEDVIDPSKEIFLSSNVKAW